MVIMQTYYFDANGKQEGFGRRFANMEEALEYRDNNMCGSEQTFTEWHEYSCGCIEVTKEDGRYYDHACARCHREAWTRNGISPRTKDISTIKEYGLTQKLSNSIRCF